MSSKNKPVGQVAFVGTGPGDPGLLTVRATEVLAGAEAVVLDRGINDEQRDAIVARWVRRERAAAHPRRTRQGDHAGRQGGAARRPAARR